MTPVLFIVAAAAGALGRHLLGQVAASWLALLVVNALGAGILGAVATSDLPTSTKTVLGVAFCGSLTTFSSSALETRWLGWRWGSIYAAVTVASACCAAAVGSALV